MSESQDAYWRDFWGRSGSIQVDRKSLARKLKKQGGLILDHVDLNGKQLLDIGAGFGFLDSYLVNHSGVTVTATDFQGHLIASDDHSGRLRRASADAFRLPFKPGSFDAVMAVEMLHHLKRSDRWRALDEMCRVLKQGGVLLLIEVNRFHPLILGLTIFDSSERNQFTVTYRHLSSLLRGRFTMIERYPLNFFLPTYKYNPPPLVETLRGTLEHLEDFTQRKYLCMEYLIVAHGYQGAGAPNQYADSKAPSTRG